MNEECSKAVLKQKIEGKLERYFGQTAAKAVPQQFYKAACMVVRDLMADRWMDTYGDPNPDRPKQVFYLSMEFLPGTSLHNNAFNLGIEEELRAALSEMGSDLDILYGIEPDAGLGNGGLGRLASCYLDAMTTQEMQAHGMSICYEYGIFKQKIENGRQVELPDEWKALGDVWLITKEDEAKEIHFGGQMEEVWDEHGHMKLIHSGYRRVIAVPKDMLISGYHSPVVNNLRLWEATSPVSIDMELFSQGKYLKSMEEKYMAEVISKILYPEDAHTEGKTLRMTQQYFFISASLQSIVDNHLKDFGTLDNFSDKVAIHINDTHPAMAIPELMRIFIDEYDFQWDVAWDIVCKTVSYTNHTVMPEALEKWPENLFAELLPRLHSIVMEISRRHNRNLLRAFPEDVFLREQMAILFGGKLRMANLCVAAAHKVNGVSALHSEIIRNDLFSGFAKLEPNKFTNVTNGIAYRRWLCQANPELSLLIEELCGPGFRKDAGELEKLLAYKEDAAVGERLEAIKRKNKIRLAEHIKNSNNVTVNIDSIFDVQVKRLHEYKRQLLNLFHIMYLYNRIKEDPAADFPPRTFIFAAKAAAGYYMAKQIIRLAYFLSRMIEKDPAVRDRIRIVFLENYSVSLSELIMPAAELSEQISLAGKEASGTGNMKLMINGAVTLGTEDGANVEIHREVGDDNIFIFGMSAQEAEELARSGRYNPWSYCQDYPEIGNVVRLLSNGIDGENFSEILNCLTTGFNGCADPYFVLADFQSYRAAQEEAGRAYLDRTRWNRMSLVNIAKAGLFSADRAVKEYADRIWGL